MEECIAHCVWHASQPQLDAVAIMDKIRHNAANCQVCLCGDRPHIIKRWPIFHRNDPIHLVHRDLQRPSEPRQIGADLQNHMLRMAAGLLFPHAAAGNGKVSMLVHGCGRCNKVVDPWLVLRSAFHHVMEIGGKMGGDPLLMTLPQRPIVEMAHHMIVCLQLGTIHKGVDIAAPPLSFDQLNVMELGQYPVEVFIEALWLTQLTAAAEHRPIRNAVEHLVNGFEPCPVLFLIRHCSSPAVILPRGSQQGKCPNPLQRYK